MDYLLDTNIISDLYDSKSEKSERIISKIEYLSNNDRILISVITLYEFEYGYNNANDDKKILIRENINYCKRNFEAIPLTIDSSLIFGNLKNALVNARKLNKETAKKINLDLIIASSAICNNCILVSADKVYRELKQLEPKLILENWVI